VSEKPPAYADELRRLVTFNLHLASVMEGMSAAERKREYIKHNFDEVGFRPLPAGRPATLDWFMEDYVEHFRHHLQQVDALLPT
jgi:hypothetical protein